jgi:flagellar M-ring protein FliF
VNEKALAFLKQIQKLWGSLSTAKRVALLVVASAILVGAIAISAFAGRENWAFLFTDMSAEDAAAVATKLKELKVPYRIEAGGTAVQVPEEKVHELRLELAGAGLPRGGGVGFELFDKSRLGATEFEQRINLRRALEGELSRTIGTIGSVQSARVHLVLPETSVFALSKQAASASVVLRLRQGRAFSKGEVAGIVHLVAAAVPGLSEDRVSIVSADGLTLHRPRADGGPSADATTQEERERELAAALEEKARAIVEHAVGPGKADVRVTALLDTASREKTEEHYEPTKTALRSEQKTEERSATDGATVAGVPGAVSNRADSTTPPETPPGAGSAWRTSWTRNWEVDRVTQKTVLPSGTIAHLSIAMLVDGRYENGKYLARPKEELDRLGALVRGAVGFDATRGDVIQIESAEFAVADATPNVPPPPISPFKKPYVLPAIGAAAMLAIAVLVLVWRSKAKKAAAKRAEEAEAAEGLALEGGTEAAQLAGGAVTPALPGRTRTADADLVRDKAFELALQDPATAAVILREWLNAPSTVTPAATPPQF